jgi:hypothetical protein
LKFRILTCISLGSHSQGKSAAKEMLSLHETRPQVATLSWMRYFEELRLCCLALVMDGSHLEAIEIVHHIGQLEESNRATISHSVLQRLLALSYVYDATLDPALAELGLQIFAASKILIGRVDDGQKYIWLLWFVAKASLDLGRFGQSKEVINRILDKKIIAPQILVVHCRVRLLLTMLGNMLEPEVVYNAANACLVFLRRSPFAPKYLQPIVQWVKKISHFEIGSKEQLAALEKAAIEVKTIYETEKEVRGLAFRYHSAFSSIADAIRLCQ